MWIKNLCILPRVLNWKRHRTSKLCSLKTCNNLFSNRVVLCSIKRKWSWTSRLTLYPTMTLTASKNSCNRFGTEKPFLITHTLARRAAFDVKRPFFFSFLETGIFKGSRQHVRDGGNHHPAESRWQRHQGELLVH